MFDLTDQQMGLLAIFVMFVLPFIVIGIVSLFLSVRDRAYDRGFNDAYKWAVDVQDRGNKII